MSAAAVRRALLELRYTHVAGAASMNTVKGWQPYGGRRWRGVIRPLGERHGVYDLPPAGQGPAPYVPSGYWRPMVLEAGARLY